MNYRNKWLSISCFASVMMGLVITSCAEGFDDDERFTQGAGVTNTQLEAPKLDPETFKTQINADGSESVEVSWPVVFGAGGYLANVNIVNDPSKPIVLVKDSIIDGCHFSFPRDIDNLYEVSVSTLGNEKLNNTGSPSPSLASYSTMLPATTIPEGVEISQFVRENIQPSKEEIGLRLLPGRTYQLTGEVDFNLTPVILLGSKTDRPLVVISKEGCFTTQAGLKIQNINFDCGDGKDAKSFIKLSLEPDASNTADALGFSGDKIRKETHIIMGQIAVESCNFRNLMGSFIWAQEKDYNLNVFRINDCIIQLNNATSSSFINFNKSAAGLIKTMAITNSTFYNLEENKDALFIKYGNQSNANPEKVFGSLVDCPQTISNCTFDKTFSGKNFANMTPQVKVYSITLDSNIFFNVYNLNKWKNGSSVMKGTNNVIWGPLIPTDVLDADLPYADKENPDFTGPTDLQFNLDLPNGGVNFHPQNSFCLTNKIGDPRWLE